MPDEDHDKGDVESEITEDRRKDHRDKAANTGENKHPANDADRQWRTDIGFHGWNLL